MYGIGLGHRVELVKDGAQSAPPSRRSVTRPRLCPPDSALGGSGNADMDGHGVELLGDTGPALVLLGPPIFFFSVPRPPGGGHKGHDSIG